MKKVAIIVVLSAVFAIGCARLLAPTVSNFLDRRSTRYVLLKKDAHLLDGPYRIVDRVSAEEIVAERENVRYRIFLRGCKGLGGLYDVHVQHSFYEDMGLYLLRECTANLSSNHICAVIYRPANRVYVGMPNGFDNLSYTMPQLLHIAYGELYVDHSDTNYPMYRTFCEAERLAKIQRKGYWATHTDPPATTTNIVSNVATNN